LSEQTRVLIVDDHTLVRQGIRHLVDDMEGLEVVAEGGNAAEALSLAALHTPDVVLLDISLPDDSGLSVATKLRAEHPETRILMLTMHDETEYVLGAVEAGAHGYVLKDAGPGELGRAIQALRDGSEYFSPAVAKQLTALIRGEVPVEPESPADALTPREKEILKHVAQGKTSRAIAEELGISPRTVESHRESLMRKLDIRSVAGLTRFAVEEGLL
jgi:DNA-binding NarL/FixJ family response regulator